MIHSTAPKPLTSQPLQVALRVFRNHTAAQADLAKMGAQFDSDAKYRGPRDFLTRGAITSVTPQMIAYAAVQVF
jgi:hypothetical protein